MWPQRFRFFFCVSGLYSISVDFVWPLVGGSVFRWSNRIHFLLWLCPNNQCYLFSLTWKSLEEEKVAAWTQIFFHRNAYLKIVEGEKSFQSLEFFELDSNSNLVLVWQKMHSVSHFNVHKSTTLVLDQAYISLFTFQAAGCTVLKFH